MIIYDVLIKRKPSLDQLRTGLGILGVLDAMKKNPASMAQYFVYPKKKMTPSDLMNKVDFDDETSLEQQQLFENVISSYSHEMIEKFLVFVSGTNNLCRFSQDQRICVKFTDAPSIFASTCTMEVNIPSQVKDILLLRSSLEAVIDTTWKQSFNTY